MKKILFITLFLFVANLVAAQETFSDLKVIRSDNQTVLTHSFGEWVNDARDVVVLGNGIQQPQDKRLMVLRGVEGAGTYSLYLQRKNYWYLVKADIAEGFTATVESRMVTSVVHIVYKDYTSEDIPL